MTGWLSPRFLPNVSQIVFLHLAAGSHVDRWLDGPANFIQTDVVGPVTLLDAACDKFRFIFAQVVALRIDVGGCIGQVAQSLAARGGDLERFRYRIESSDREEDTQNQSAGAGSDQ